MRRLAALLIAGPVAIIAAGILPWLQAARP